MATDFLLLSDIYFASLNVVPTNGSLDVAEKSIMLKMVAQSSLLHKIGWVILC